jgi:hypothetical protein
MGSGVMEGTAGTALAAEKCVEYTAVEGLAIHTVFGLP